MVHFFSKPLLCRSWVPQPFYLIYIFFFCRPQSHIHGLLICTLISENQGLEKSRSASSLRKISGPANLDFFLGLHLEKKLDLYHNPEKNPGDKLKKKSRCAGSEIFLRFGTDLDFQKSRCRLKGRHTYIIFSFKF